MEYESISLNGIAREAGFSKPNVYRYFESREEIFLVIFEELQEAFSERLTKRISRIRSVNPVERIVDIWVDEVQKHPFYLMLLPQLMTSLEKNSSIHSIVEFKKSSMAALTQLVELLNRIHSELNVEQWTEIVQLAFALMAGVWPMTQPTEKVQQAMNIAQMDVADWQFEKLMKQGLKQLIQGASSTTTKSKSRN